MAIGLVHAVGGGPNPAQRQETTRFRRTEATVSVRYAILTDVSFHRAFINVVNLFERVPFRAFRSRELKEALSYLGAAIPEAEVRRHFAYMAGLLGIVGYRLPLSVSGHRDPRADGEERQGAAGAVHRSPARSWAGSALAG